MKSTSPTVLLVHGAFADGSSWNEVVAELQADGIPVRALAHPLRGLYADAAYVANAAAQVDGPVVLVGHSYGGMVITEGGAEAPNVIGLVYVAAFIPELGETLASINTRYPTTSTPPQLIEATYPGPVGGESHVELSISSATFPTAFAADLPIEVTRVAAATQRPPALACFEEAATRTAWRELPSWALVATADQMIHPDAQHDMAERAGATTISVDASHAVAQSQPRIVVDTIRQAVSTAVPA
ncbi:MAG: alpha/beta fold hydrolase [Ilumatobacteraceae bacterium]